MAIIARRQAGQQQRITDEATEVRRDINQYGQSGRNMQAIGQSFGVVEEKFRELEQLNEQTTSLIELDKTSNLINSKIQERMLLPETDPNRLDPFKAKSELEKEMDTLYKKTSSRISNPQMRARFDLQASSTLQSNVAKIQNVIHQRQIFDAKENHDVVLSSYVSQWLNSNSESEKARIMESARTSIKDGIGKFYDGEQALTKLSTWESNLVKTKINDLLLDKKDPGAARAFFESDFAQLKLTNEEKKSYREEIRKESVKSNSRVIAAQILSDSEDNFDIASDRMAKIENEELRVEVKKQYEVLRREQESTWNVFEGDIAKRISDGEYTELDLENDASGMTKETYKAIKESFDVIPQFDMTMEEGKLEESGTFSGLFNEYLQIASSSDPINRTRDLMSYRRKVFANKGRLQEGSFKRLLAISEPGKVESASKNAPVQKSMLDTVNDFFETTKFLGKDEALKELADLFEKPIKKDDVPILLKTILDDIRTKNNPAFRKYELNKPVSTPNGDLMVVGYDEFGDAIGKYI